MAIDPTRVHFDPETHTYRIDGRIVPNITEILRVATFDDFEFVTPEQLEKARLRGQAGHLAIEGVVKGTFNPFEAEPEVVETTDAFSRFLSDSGFEPLMCEAVVASLMFRYAGRLDLFGKMDGRQALIDVKNTAAPPASTALQTAGQEVALRETYDVTGEIDRYCLHISGGRYKLIPYTDKTDQRVFFAALSVTNWRAS